MTMSARARKATLTAHVAVSVGWIGAVVVYLVLGVTAITSESIQTVRAVWLAMEAAGWFAIVPLALTSLGTGLIMALGTRWGLFRHYWVLISFLLTLLSAVVLVLHMPTVSTQAALAQQSQGAALEALGGDLAHPGVGLVILLTIQALNMYKPRGMTRYGWRKQQDKSD